MAYHKSSFWRSFSATSHAGVLKSASSTAIRERRFLILFLTATVSCTVSGKILSKRLQTNFILSVNSGDDTEGSLERTKCLCSLTCNIKSDGSSPKRSVHPASLPDWWTSARDECHNRFERTSRCLRQLACSLFSVNNVLFWYGDALRSTRTPTPMTVTKTAHLRGHFRVHDHRLRCWC